MPQYARQRKTFNLGIRRIGTIIEVIIMGNSRHAHRFLEGHHTPTRIGNRQIERASSLDPGHITGMRLQEPPSEFGNPELHQVICRDDPCRLFQVIDVEPQGPGRIRGRQPNAGYGTGPLRIEKNLYGTPLQRIPTNESESVVVGEPFGSPGSNRPAVITARLAAYIGRLGPTSRFVHGAHFAEQRPERHSTGCIGSAAGTIRYEAPHHQNFQYMSHRD